MLSRIATIGFTMVVVVLKCGMLLSQILPHQKKCLILLLSTSKSMARLGLRVQLTRVIGELLKSVVGMKMLMVASAFEY